jgi:hypothetical protein
VRVQSRRGKNVESTILCHYIACPLFQAQFALKSIFFGPYTLTSLCLNPECPLQFLDPPVSSSAQTCDAGPRFPAPLASFLPSFLPLRKIATISARTRYPDLRSVLSLRSMRDRRSRPGEAHDRSDPARRGEGRSIFIVRLCARTCRGCWLHVVVPQRSLLFVLFALVVGRSVSRSVGLGLPKKSRNISLKDRSAQPDSERTSLVAFDT